MNRYSTLSAAAVCSALLLAACGGASTEGEARQGEEGASPVERTVPVSVRAVVPEPFAETINLTGFAKAVDDVIVSAEEGGVLKEWLHEKGAKVRRGEILARIKDDILRPTYDAARAQYRIAELTFDRQKAVFAEDGLSEVQFKTFEYNRDAAKAQADIARARWERTRIVSPIDGILDDRLVDAGELVSPGSPVARVVNLRKMKVVLSVPERFAGSLSTGASVRCIAEAHPGETLNGTVAYVGAAVVADNRTVPAEVRFSDARGKLKPDMIVRATIVQSARRTAIQVEESLVQQIDRNTSVVYVVTDNTARRRIVTLGGRSEDRVEIVKGLSPGDRLIVSGFQNVLDGQLVSVEQE